MAQQQLYPRSITQNLRFDGPVLLRDGRSAILREAGEADLPALVELLERTSDQSIKLRFFGPMRRDERTARFLIRDHMDGVDSGRFKGLSLIMLEGTGEDEKIIAVASCIPLDRERAEVAFLVEDDAHGRGIGTLMIERLAYAAEVGGLKKLVATTVAENDVMIRVFQDCGYDVVSRLRTGEFEVAFEITPSEQSVESVERRDMLASRASIRPLFYPESIAIVGASRDETKIGSRVLQNLVAGDYQGKVYAVHPEATELGGIAALPSLAEVPEPIDLVVLAIEAQKVLDVAHACVENGAHNLLVLSDGFAETNDEGRVRQDQLLELARANGMRLVGPNCLGLVNTDPDAPVHLTPADVTPPVGNLAMSSQSGSLSLAILDGASDKGIGFSSFINVGNKADVSGNDLLQYWEDDARTKLILLYLESLGNPRRFARLARRVSRKKPILVVKSGRTGSHPLEEGAYFKQIGVIRSDSLEQMFDLANLLSHQPLPQGNRVAIISNSRGIAGICAQTFRGWDLRLAELAPGDRDRLAAILPDGAAVDNPIDLTPAVTPDAYREALETLIESDGVDAVIAMYIARSGDARDQIVTAIQAAREHTASWHSKPLLCCFMDRLSEQPEPLDANEKIPCYPFPESAAHVLARAFEYSNWLRRPSGIIPALEGMDIEKAWGICNAAGRTQQQDGGSLLPYADSVDLLRAIGLALTRSAYCTDWQRCAAEAETIAYPLVLHSLDEGRTIRDIAGPAELWSAWEQLHGEDHAAAVIVEAASVPAIPVNMSIADDPDFGPVAMFGLSGVSADLFEDVAYRISPLTDQDAIEMLHEIKSHPILDGYDDGLVADKDGIIDGLLRLSWLMEEVPVIRRIDLFHAQALEAGQGLVVCSARVQLKVE